MIVLDNSILESKVPSWTDATRHIFHTRNTIGLTEVKWLKEKRVNFQQIITKCISDSSTSRRYWWTGSSLMWVLIQSTLEISEVWSQGTKRALLPVWLEDNASTDMGKVRMGVHSRESGMHVLRDSLIRHARHAWLKRLIVSGVNVISTVCKVNCHQLNSTA